MAVIASTDALVMLLPACLWQCCRKHLIKQNYKQNYDLVAGPSNMRPRRAQFRGEKLPAIMPRVMIGVLFMLEVAWILFLVYAFVRFALPGRWAHVILGAGTSAR